ncbi:NADH-quinone oxidoreductase subunit N [Tuwongella immobilis]|uniref:NADH-quinone oxidoreductase subunit N n=1 Tax=Tuwongella immobilis TaxID=692036 RepID=A0A6C2YHR4_9BACT|nr:NADH-quinone oxidoreductase subunit N [Tuwongella immobilis]VIP00904.1 nadh-quinone oxidoreductase subunit n : NADH-quinone oxidoreductase subunit N OS=Singulisphaera acidiphila (strain ATCC BAA-1392 / DSM 18658 / VKM B-2454 / MOB10) GN=nuoN PE=3 SV=1: Oxidored_q1 [Tuwongella immobilis]VTR97226.1 nadh-quinone oxidoreductase subunit n : NADH-quinone oxidoreductase subunit N OS=Singulisphaera acidiphila (strain ATCC BAA-1392 / DSM 18658 / VKM B-2454 / MOB10) GN=nuoN PE=3 SV=1: Oxidored_q1 [Tuwon
MNQLHSDAVDQTLRLVFQGVVPEIVLVVTACVLFLLGTLRAGRAMAMPLAMLGLLGAAIAAAFVKFPDPALMIPTIAPLSFDPLAIYLRCVVIISGALYLLVATAENTGRSQPEYLGCLLVAIAGLSLSCAANDLVTIFLSLEMISIPTYVMLYLGRNDRQGQEAAVKYFLLSILSSAFLLFGFSYLYGMTGVTNVTALLKLMPAMASSPAAILALVAVIMVLAGIGFRLTAVPFHFYAPDVYQGAPTGVVSFLAYAPKVAGFAVLFRLFAVTTNLEAPIYPNPDKIAILLWVMAAITMTLGNVLALLQDNIRRLLAYSSVAHAGYMLMGLAAATQPAAAVTGDPFISGSEAILFYLVAYGAMTIGFFAVLMNLGTPERPIDAIDELAGVGQSHPFLGISSAIFLFSLMGLPATAGFAGKFFLFAGTMNVPTTGSMGSLYQVLVLVAAVNAAIGAYYYLRVLGVMYLRSTLSPLTTTPKAPLVLAIVICVLITIGFGVYPWPLVAEAEFAVQPLILPPAVALGQ